MNSTQTCSQAARAGPGPRRLMRICMMQSSMFRELVAAGDIVLNHMQTVNPMKLRITVGPLH